MSSGPNLPNNPSPAYQYASPGTADAGALSGTQNLPNYAQQNYPQVQAATQNITSGAYGAPAIQGAGNAAINAGNSVVPYATQALNAGFDPQNQAYNTGRQVNDQTTAVNNAANGVSGSPYAAGVANTSDQNFDLNWQNQMLQRQQAGAGTAEGLLGTQGNSATTGANLLTGAANNPLSALSSLNSAGGQATGVDQTMIQDFLSYLTGGTSASNAATGQYSAEANAALGQQGVTNSGLGGLGSLAGSLLGGSGIFSSGGALGGLGSLASVGVML